MNTCQACECAPVDVAEPSDNRKYPYHLCEPCHKRLLSYSLRPNEWYNLAKRFGCWQFLLHDDFYDDDGKAAQPEEEFEFESSFAAPTLTDVSYDLNRTIDHIFTLWHPSEDYFEVLKSFPKDQLIIALEAKLATSPNNSYGASLFDICGEVLKDEGSDLVRSGWKIKDSIDFVSLAFATTQCLPKKEGFQLIDKELQAMPLQNKRDCCFVLSYYKSPQVFEWLEDNIQSPITETWGRVAACTGADWTILLRWLDGGRPLSLVALDCMKSCIHYDTPFTKKLKPSVSGEISSIELQAALKEYLKKDSVPRVEKAVTYLTKHTEELTSR